MELRLIMQKYLDVVMPMYHLIEYSKIYSKTSVTLCDYYKDVYRM